MRFLAPVLLAALSCAPLQPPTTPPAETQEQAWHRARVIEANVNGCAGDCPPSGASCVDDYGLCWTKCAWEHVGHDETVRTLLHQAATSADPTRSFLVECPAPPGGLEALR